MKKLALAALIAVAGTAAMAGTIIEPVIEPEVVVEHTHSSMGGIIIPILLLVGLAIALR